MWSRRSMKDTGRLVAEIPGGERLPESVLHQPRVQRQASPASIYGGRGRPAVAGSQSKRTRHQGSAQAADSRPSTAGALPAPPILRHMRCPPCEPGAPWVGPTDASTTWCLACWRCHNKIHHFGWQIHGPPGRRTLHPPDDGNLRPRPRPRDGRASSAQAHPTRRTRPTSRGFSSPSPPRCPTRPDCLGVSRWRLRLVTVSVGSLTSVAVFERREQDALRYREPWRRPILASWLVCVQTRPARVGGDEGAVGPSSRSGPLDEPHEGCQAPVLG